MWLHLFHFEYLIFHKRSGLLIKFVKKQGEMKRVRFLVIIIFQCLIFSITKAQTNVTISGIVKDKNSKANLPFVNVVLKTEKDSSFISGTVSDEDGRFSIAKIKSGNYDLEVSFVGYNTTKENLFIGNLSEYLNLKTIELEEKSTELEEK